MDVHGRTRVFVVEDEPAIRMFLVDALEDEGYEVKAAANGVQALELLAAEQWRPDVIVLDMQMPAMDGIAFAEAYRHAPEPHAPIVVVTAYRTQGRRAVELGAEDMLLKPVDLDTLLEQVARHARNSTSHQPPPLRNVGRAALLVAAALLGVAAATPVLAQTRTPGAHRALVAGVETSSVMVDAQGTLLSAPAHQRRIAGP